ncbi:methyltransferase domain-containing protein [Shouchella clausii]|uniref:putative RNA methyltransferase n=1 Tax=Shouchella TaxID=2893057 RepID=UPI0004E693A8|nr:MULTISPECIES: methyltransferase domain-containing protein [Shouchella]ALA53800.1 Ribosomal RNA large subunit methyltransferase A [Shouchella clausii]MBU3229635.1 methyltransferase domain-containing protein [Shouchella clausii]MBU3264281.1 methyltransferase domain-containing protein [Shouchella clausii]MBU3506536.1 methyltransferase domain-containing protein [Shouchella clausii]MBU3535780.1 methyltransferase domain-containing protein [Shouchella clausii]
MAKLTKKAKAAIRAKSIETLFQCPYCQLDMHVEHEASFICKQKHTFDFAKQGHLYLLTGQKRKPSQYNTSLFEARQQIIMESGLFDRFHAKMRKLLAGTTGTVVDLGCGEGSHLKSIVNEEATVAIGLDIAKEGIVQAAKSYEGILWLVGDLAYSPFKAHSMDVILTILSPSNYKEYKRLLAPGGNVVKVVPQRGYLQELRTFFYAGQEKETYSNEEMISLFKQHFRETTIKTITYSAMIKKSDLPALLKMTPLTWKAQNERKIAFLDQDVMDVTIDFAVLIGKEPRIH